MQKDIIIITILELYTKKAIAVTAPLSEMQFLVTLALFCAYVYNESRSAEKGGVQ